jgi:hypothetical protein
VGVVVDAQEGGAWRPGLIGRVLWRLVKRWHPFGEDITEEMLAGIDVMVGEQRARDEAG